MLEKLIRINAVMEATGKSRSSIYADINNGNFPRPVPIGARAVAWPMSEIAQWIKLQIALARDEHLV